MALHDAASGFSSVDVAALLDRLAKIQALYDDGAATSGERQAAAAAAERVRERLAREMPGTAGAGSSFGERPHGTAGTAEAQHEYRISIEDAWSRKLFIGIARRHGVHPYRYRGQRRTTLLLRTTKQMLEKVIYPHYSEAAAVLREHFDAIADRVISEALHVSTDDAEVRAEAITPVASAHVLCGPASGDQ